MLTNIIILGIVVHANMDPLKKSVLLSTTIEFRQRNAETLLKLKNVGYMLVLTSQAAGYSFIKSYDS